MRGNVTLDGVCETRRPVRVSRDRYGSRMLSSSVTVRAFRASTCTVLYEMFLTRYHLRYVRGWDPLRMPSTEVLSTSTSPGHRGDVLLGSNIRQELVCTQSSNHINPTSFSLFSFFNTKRMTVRKFLGMPVYVD